MDGVFIGPPMVAAAKDLIEKAKMFNLL
jgi:predicted PurR-regulated permease PerM